MEGAFKNTKHFELDIMSPEEAVAWLDEKGINHEEGVTPIPILSNRVVCGTPQDMGDVMIEEYSWMPKSMTSVNPIQFWTATGDSMIGGKISEGDLLRVEMGVVPSDGETVVASIDNEYTCKVYFSKRKGEHWLCPLNSRHDCILLREQDNVRIVGVVRDVTSRSRPIPFRECMDIIEEYLQRTQQKGSLRKQVEEALREGCYLFWAGSSWAVLYGVLRNCCNYEGTVSDFERGAMTLKLPLNFDHNHKCTAGKVQRTISNHPYMRLHIDKWKENGASTREIVLLEFLRKYLE